jgi:hypothetical protein
MNNTNIIYIYLMLNNLEINYQYIVSMNSKKKTSTLGSAKKAKEMIFQVVRMTFKTQPKGKRTRWVEQTRTFTAFGKNKTDLNAQILTKFDYIKYQIEENSPTASKDFGYEVIEETRKPLQVKGKQGYMTKKMKQTTLLLDGDDKQEWDTGTGRCVFDYLIYKYGELKGFKKCMNYEYLDDLFAGRLNENYLDSEGKVLNPNQKPLEEGVSVFQLEVFCSRFGIRMYVYDIDDQCIHHYTPPMINKNGRPLIYRIYNNHIYPIEDETERKSMVGKTLYDERPEDQKAIAIRSKDIEIMEESKATETEYNIVAPPVRYYEGTEIEQPYNEDERNAFALDYIYKMKKLPFPINKSKLYFQDGAISNMKVGDDYIMTTPPNEMIKKYMDTNDFVFQGEEPVHILYQLWKDTYCDDDGNPISIHKNEMRSNVNTAVAKVLLAEGVKYRTHYGATRDLSEYMEMIEEYETITKIEEEVVDTPFGKKKKKTKQITNKLKPKRRLLDKMIDEGEIIGCDIEKCYASCLLNPQDDWIVLDFLDEVENFIDNDYEKLPLGLYYVETNDLTLLHQSNWYSNNILDMAKELGIEFKIAYQILDKLKYKGEERNSDYFHSIITAALDEFADFPELRKLVINQITGCLGKTNGTSLEVHLNNNLEEVWEKFVMPNAEKNKDVFIQPLKHNDETLWIYGNTKKTEWLDFNLPMYIQILDWSNMMLYDMAKQMGGEVLFRKTDCVVVRGGKPVKEKTATPYEEDNYNHITDTWGSYRNEDKEHIKQLNYETTMRENRHIEKPEVENLWTTYDYCDSDEWEKIIKTAIEKKGMLIMGRAGTGKSYVPKKAVEEKLIKDDTKCRLAFTNKASRNINGTTIHKALAINSKNKTNNKTLAKYKSTDVIIVDEISMINADLWKLLSHLKKTSGATFILLGDYRQCRPIEEDRIDIEDATYFNHPVVKYLTNNNRCELNVRKRYDEALWNYAEDFYERDVVGRQIKEKRPTIEQIYLHKNICYLNKTRDRINDSCMEHFKEQTDSIYLPYERKDDKDRPNSVHLFIGLPIMSIKNDSELGIINSDEFQVVNFDEDNFTAERVEDGTSLEFECDDFHKYFVANYCSTTHKSQGATITEPIYIWDWERMSADKNVGYTALTRAKELKQLTFAI